MNFEIIGKPDFPLVKVNLESGESLSAESGAMVAMSPSIKMETKAKGGVIKSAKRAFLGGESFFINNFTAETQKGEVYFASATTGDMEKYDLHNSELILSTGAFVCSTPGIDLDSKWGGFKAMFSGEGLLFLKASGNGTLIFSSFGAIHEVAIEDEYIVDTGHIVAFEPSLEYKIEKIGGLKSLFFSGEGLVCRFKGKGKLYIQTRNQNTFAAWANQFRRVETSSN